MPTEKHGPFMQGCRDQCGWASRPRDTRAGSSACWPSWDTSCGSATRRRSGHALAMGEGVCRKKQLWTKKGRAELQALNLGAWASYRRQELLEMVDQLDGSLEKLDRAVAEQSQQNEAATLLQTHPGVGPVTSLAFVLTLGPVERFKRSKQVVSYLGLNPREHSSGGKQRLGAISKQGNPMMRSLLVEAGHSAARLDAELHKDYQRLKLRRGSGVAKVAIARKLAVRMYWMLRQQASYAQLVRMQGSPRATLVQQ